MPQRNHDASLRKIFNPRTFMEINFFSRLFSISHFFHFLGND
eukprot:UN25402